MKSTHSENLQFLKNIRGCFGSRRMWSVEYEFTGKEIIERRGGRKKNQISISDIIETEAPLGKKLMILKTNNSKIKIQIIPSLNEAIQNEAARELATKSEGERRRFEEVKNQIIKRRKWAALIGAIVSIFVAIAGSLLLRWFHQKH
jgi:hypothetical protein